MTAARQAALTVTAGRPVSHARRFISPPEDPAMVDACRNCRPAAGAGASGETLIPPAGPPGAAGAMPPARAAHTRSATASYPGDQEAGPLREGVRATGDL